MKNLCKIQAVLAIVLVGSLKELGADVYTSTNPMPELTTSELLRDTRNKLDELFRAGDNEHGGVQGLLDQGLWKPWIKGGLYYTNTQKAITNEKLKELRDKILPQVSIIATIFSDAAKAKKGSPKDFVKANAAVAVIDSLLKGIVKPCGVPNSAGDCAKLDFQEQWSLLKIIARVFPHNVKAMEPVFVKIDLGEESVNKLRSGIEKSTTLLFLGDLDLKSNFSEQDRAKYSFIFNNADKIDKNIFLAVPLPEDKNVKSFINYLAKVISLIGSSDKQREKDAKVIAQYWKSVMDGLQSAFKALHKLQKKDVIGERIKTDKINIKLLPWDKSFYNLVAMYFSWLPTVQAKVTEIINRSEKGKESCAFAFLGNDCRTRYELLILVSGYLKETLNNINRSLTDLRALTKLEMIK